MGLADPRFRKGETVVWKAHRNLGGGRIVRDPEPAAGEWWYRVKFAARVKNLVEEDLEAMGDPDRTPDELASEGLWGAVNAFRQAVVVERFVNRRNNRSTIYAFRNQKLLFAAHQYKPLLKFLSSPDRRLLIADEVGLGKTIEAGLILAELRARMNIARILVVCPSRLREKWQQELSRKFGFDFDIMARPEIERWLKKCREQQGSRELRAIVSQQTLRQEDLHERFLTDTLPLDLVIVDEAHHARNPGTLTSKLVQGLGDHADAVLLLTATPINLRNRDLFTLLRALRPSEFRDEAAFEAEMARYAHLRRGVKIARQQNTARLPEIAELIRATFADGLGIVSDQLAAHLLDELECRPPQTRRDWVELERRIEELHLLSPILTRSRKRDVQEHAPVRRSMTHICHWSPEEQRAYCRILGVEEVRPWPDLRIGIGMIQRYRWAASCLPAAIESLRRQDGTADWDDSIDIDPDDFADLEEPERPPLPGGALKLDAKLKKLIEILREIDREDPGTKIIVFTYFRGTSQYLAKELARMGWKSCRIAGDVRSDPRNPEQDDRGKTLEEFREDPTVRVLVSTEVGSEGLDFQFCHTLVNYDLPWNPMVVEQRIGRIDRFGQKSDVIHIHNLVVDGTVEERVLARLYKRIGIFEHSIGDLEQILGEQVRQLSAEIFRGTLTPNEADRRVKEAVDAIERKRRDEEILEQRQSELLGHEDYIREELGRIQRLGRHVSGTSMRCVVEGFLERYHSTARIRPAGDGLYHLRIDEELCRLVGSAVGPNGEREMRCLMRRRDVQFTFDGQIAYETKGVVLLNPEHSLVRTAIKRVQELLEDPQARVAAAQLEVVSNEDPGIPAGWTFLASFRQEVTSARSRNHLVAFGWSDAEARLLDEEAAERLLHLVTESATLVSRETAIPALSRRVWEELMNAARAANRQLEQAERRENEAWVERRRRQLETEFDRREANIRQKIVTAQQRERDESVLAMFEAQLSKTRKEKCERLKQMESSREVSVGLSDALAICAVYVVHVDNAP